MISSPCQTTLSGLISRTRWVSFFSRRQCNVSCFQHQRPSLNEYMKKELIKNKQGTTKPKAQVITYVQWIGSPYSSVPGDPMSLLKSSFTAIKVYSLAHSPNLSGRLRSRAGYRCCTGGCGSSSRASCTPSSVAGASL